MKLRGIVSGCLMVTLALGLAPTTASADEAADKAAEIKRKREEAKKRIEERNAAVAAAKKAQEEAAAAQKKAEEEKKAADEAKAAAEKAAAEKKAAAAGGSASGGTSGGGGAAATATAGTGGTSATKTAPTASAAPVEEKDAPLPTSDIEALRKDRAERRKGTVERLRRRWGRVLADEKGAADLKLHSRRVAFLQRIRAVAEAKKDRKTIEAVDELITQEDDRHSKVMNGFREGALSAGGAK